QGLPIGCLAGSHIVADGGRAVLLGDNGGVAGQAGLVVEPGFGGFAHGAGDDGSQLAGLAQVRRAQVVAEIVGPSVLLPVGIDLLGLGRGLEGQADAVGHGSVLAGDAVVLQIFSGVGLVVVGNLFLAGVDGRIETVGVGGGQVGVGQIGDKALLVG